MKQLTLGYLLFYAMYHLHIFVSLRMNPPERQIDLSKLNQTQNPWSCRESYRAATPKFEVKIIQRVLYINVAPLVLSVIHLSNTRTK